MRLYNDGTKYTIKDLQYFIGARLRQKSSKTGKLIKINTFKVSKGGLEDIIETTKAKNEFKKIIGNHYCKYCNDIANGRDEDILCEGCIETFGHRYFYEL